MLTPELSGFFLLGPTEGFFFNNFEVAGFAGFLDYEHLIGKLTVISRLIFKIAGENHRPLLLPDNRVIGFVYL